jgi:predicted deacylase
LYKPIDVSRGVKEFNWVPVVDNLLVQAKIPVGVVNGLMDGPTLAVTAGLYPTEYCGVEAASRLYQTVEPENLNGRLIIIPVMNLPAFQWRHKTLKLKSTGTSPFDGVGINNVFPGDPTGSLTQRIAYKNYKILSEADYHVDFRGGDLPESHLAHTIQLRLGKKIDETTLAMAKIFGLEYVLPGTPDIGHTSPGTLINTLVTDGVPSIISEAGLGYRTQPLEKFVMDHVNGIMNLMKHFDMIDGEPIKPKNQRFLDMEWVGVTAPDSGIFMAYVDQGDKLSKGELVGLIKHIDGSTVAKVESPIDGIVHTMYPERLVFTGERLYTLLRVLEPTGW